MYEYYENEKEIPRRLRRFYRKKKAKKKEKEKGGIFAFLSSLFGKKGEEKKALAIEREAKRKKAEVERILAEMKWRAKVETEERMANEIFEQLLEAKQKVPKEKEKYKQAREMTVKELREFRRRHKRLPTKDEYEEIAEAVVEQLKAPPHKIKEILEEEKKKLEKEKEEVIKKVEEKAKVGEKKKKETGKKPKSELELLEMPESEEGLEGLESMEEIGSIEEIPEEESLENLGMEEIGGIEEVGKGNICPKCKKETKELIYCPKCGNAFCSNCAKSKKETPIAIEYVCPYCGHKFKKKKK